MAEMATEQTPIVISADSELGIALKRASTEHEPVAIRIGDESYEVDVFESHADAEPSESSREDSILSIIGIGSSGEPTDIARFKDQYLADAYDHRKR